jgi:hypothetical protein
MMKRYTSLAGMFMAVIFVMACIAATAQAADPSGTWKWKVMRSGGQEFELSLALKLEGEKLTGAVTLPMGQSVDIKDGTFKDDEVSFVTEMERNGTVFKTKYKGKLTDDTIKGTTERERNGETMTREWEAKRDKK